MGRSALSVSFALALFPLLLPGLTAQAQAVAPKSTGPDRPQAPPLSYEAFRKIYFSECQGKPAKPERLAFCECSFAALSSRYSLRQYAELDKLIRSGPPSVRRFAAIAWEPEFARCRASTGGGANRP